MRQSVLYVLFAVLMSGPAAGGNALAQCPLSASFSDWKRLETEHRSLTANAEEKQWDDVVRYAEPRFERSFDPQEREFFRYYYARGLIRLGDGKAAVPILTDTTRVRASAETDMAYFQVMNAKLGLNYIGRFTDPEIGIRYFEALEPWLELSECDSLIDPVSIYRHAGEQYFYGLDSDLLAETYYDKAFDYWKAHDGDSIELPPLLYNLAALKTKFLQHGIALEYIHAAERIARRYPDRYSGHFRLNCMNIEAMIYFHWHRYDKVAEVMEALIESRETDEHVYRFDHLAGEYRNLSLAYKELGRYEAAEEALMHAMEIAELKREHQDISEQINFYNDLFDLFRMQGDLDEAERLADANAERLEQLGDAFGYDHFYFVRNRSLLYTAQRNPSSALDLLEPLLNDPGPAADKFLRSAPLTEVDLCVLAGDNRRAIYRKSRDISEYDRALQYYGRADSLLHLVRAGSPWRPSSQYIAEHFRELFEKMLRVTADRGELTADHADRVFRIMERNKALLLNEARNSNRFRAYHGLPEDTLSTIQEYERGIAELNMQIRADDRNEDRLRLDRLQSDYHDLLASVNPEFIDRTEIISLSGWRSAVSRPWIQYFLGDSLLFILASDGDKVEFDSRRAGEGFRADLDTVIRFVRNYSTSADRYRRFTAAAGRLYDILVPEFIRDDRFREVILIPDGALAFLPFEVLLTGPADAPPGNFRDLPYWVKDVGISYGLSASLWETLRLPGNATWLSTGYSGETEALPASEKEIERMAAAWPGPFRRAAGKRDFFVLADSAAVLHFAAHAEAGLEEGRENRIRLCDDVLDPRCTIEGYELLQLDLDGRLVFLNACETSYGIEKTGEGVYSLTRDFAMAGVPSVVSNLWKVEDNAARELMDRTVRTWRSKRKLSGALAAAKRGFIADSDPRAAHPFFWAGTILVGESRLTGGGLTDMQRSIALIVALILLAFMLSRMSANRMRN